MTPDQRMRTAATAMLLWDHPKRWDAIKTLMVEMKGTPLAPILDAYLSDKKIDPSPVGDLIPSAKQVAEAQIGLRDGSTNAHVMEYCQRRFAFDGQKWFCQPTGSRYFVPVSVQEVPYQCREAMFWCHVTNYLNGLAELATQTV